MLISREENLHYPADYEKILESSYYKIFNGTSLSKNISVNALQKKLNYHYKRLMDDPTHFQDIPDDLADFTDVRAIENAWNKYLDLHISYNLPKRENFRDWYIAINQEYNRAAEWFFDYFSEKASLAELAIYLIFEERVDGSFDDIVALAQVGVRGKSKMVLAENYWDELGNGSERDVHTCMFSKSVNYLKPILNNAYPNLNVLNDIPTNILANGNMLLMYANRRKYILRFLGAIGILEDTAPERFKSTVKAMKRLNLPKEVLRYHEVHISCDSKHGDDILEHVLIPMVNSGDDTVLIEICKGILIRMKIANDYYISLKSTFDLLK